MKRLHGIDGSAATLPAKRGIRLIGLQLLDRAEAAFGRVSQPDDAGALHDFRVALRRLRSHMRSYRPWLGESIDRKQERHVRRIARASNGSRDYEVLLDWLRKIDSPSSAEQKAIAALETQFAEGFAQAADAFRREALHEFPALARQLRIGLASYRTELRTDGGREEPLGRVTARLANRQRDEMQDDFGAVLSIEHQEEAHDARIAGKKLRYMLEPFQDECHQCAEAVTALKALQERLGELHDIHLLLRAVEETVADAEPSEQPNLSALRERINQMRTTSFEEVKREYLDSVGALVVDLTRLAERALRRSSQQEIERKFLLKRMPRIKHCEELHIRQGYLPGDDIKERVRSIESALGRKYYRTLKSGQGVSRLEIEEETSEKMFKRLFSLTKGQRVRKRRYIVEENGMRWEIDRFLDRKLVLAEVELDSPDDPVEFPRWLAGLVVREVTDDPEFSNARLAK